MSLILGGVNMVVYSIFAASSWWLIEHVGRRKLFLAGTVGQCLSMVIVFACLIPQDINPNNTGPAKGAAFGLFAYIAFFGATWLPLPWLYPAEINPLKTRAKANAVSTCSNWLWYASKFMFTSKRYKLTNLQEFHHRYGDTRDDIIYRLGHLSFLRGRKFRLLFPHLVSNYCKKIMRTPTDDLQLLLPGNQGPITRGDRHHFRQGLCGEHDLCQSGQRAALLEQCGDRCKGSGVWLLFGRRRRFSRQREG
jgi:hypothetical protein